MLSSNLRKRSATLSALISIVAFAWLLANAANALAISAPIHISGTAGEGVFIRSGPSTANSGVGWMPEGASPDYNCFAWGQNINGVPIWFNVNYGGVTGYYASFYDDSSYHSNEELTAKYGVPLCGSAPPPPSSPPAPGSAQAPPSVSGGGLVFPIVNADGGVYYRRSPSWSDTARTPGVGVYNGDRVELVCGALGDAIGPYNNKAWSKVRNLSRPIGEGWVNEHFIDDGAASNAFVAGEPRCGASNGGLRNGSLYFSPYPANPNGPNSTGQIKGDNPLGIGTNWVKAPSPANITLNLNDWDKNLDGKGCPELRGFVPPGLAAGQVSTLASWSRARAAPFLFLQARSDLRASVHYILLFDPGDQEEWDTAPCSKEYPLSNILRAWLIESPSNKLAILAGELTADPGHSSIDGHGHAGIQDQLFVPLKRQAEPPGRHLRSQIVVCNYDHTSHPDVWIDFKAWINKPPITLSSCPNDPYNDRPPTSWNP
jgi:uncharacterized protein YraI